MEEITHAKSQRWEVAHVFKELRSPVLCLRCVRCRVGTVKDEFRTWELCGVRGTFRKWSIPCSWPYGSQESTGGAHCSVVVRRGSRRGLQGRVKSERRTRGPGDTSAGGVTVEEDSVRRLRRNDFRL